MKMRIKEGKSNRLPEVGEWFYVIYNPQTIFMRCENSEGRNGMPCIVIYDSVSEKKVGVEWLFREDCEHNIVIVEPESEIILVRKG